MSHSDLCVVPARDIDISRLAEMNAESFKGNGDCETALDWVSSLFVSHPVYRYFIAWLGGEAVGYIGWQQHGGFKRELPIFELEQLAVKGGARGHGIGPKLIELSAEYICTEQSMHADKLCLVVWCKTLNAAAMATYAKWFPEIVGGRTVYEHDHETMFRKIIDL